MCVVSGTRPSAGPRITPTLPLVQDRIQPPGQTGPVVRLAGAMTLAWLIKFPTKSSRRSPWHIPLGTTKRPGATARRPAAALRRQGDGEALRATRRLSPVGAAPRSTGTQADAPRSRPALLAAEGNVRTSQVVSLWCSPGASVVARSGRTGSPARKMAPCQALARTPRRRRRLGNARSLSVLLVHAMVMTAPAPARPRRFLVRNQTYHYDSL